MGWTPSHTWVGSFRHLVPNWQKKFLPQRLGWTPSLIHKRVPPSPGSQLANKVSTSAQYLSAEQNLDLPQRDNAPMIFSIGNRHASYFVNETIKDKQIKHIILLLVCNRARHWITAVESDTIFFSSDCFKLPDWLFLKSYSFSRQISQILLLNPPKCPNPSMCYHVIYSLPVSLEWHEAFRNYKCCHQKISFPT